MQHDSGILLFMFGKWWYAIITKQSITKKDVKINGPENGQTVFEIYHKWINGLSRRCNLLVMGISHGLTLNIQQIYCRQMNSMVFNLFIRCVFSHQITVKWVIANGILHFQLFLDKELPVASCSNTICIQQLQKYSTEKKQILYFPWKNRRWLTNGPGCIKWIKGKAGWNKNKLAMWPGKKEREKNKADRHKSRAPCNQQRTNWWTNWWTNQRTNQRTNQLTKRPIELHTCMYKEAQNGKKNWK